MEVTQIVIFVFILLVVVYVAINAFSKSSNLTQMADGKKTQTIKPEKLKNSNNSNNFTYSMWLFVDDWNYNFGQEKTVLDRQNSPTVVLGDKPNTLKVYMNYYDSSKGPRSSGRGGNQAALPNNPETDDACKACESGYACACDSCANGVPDSDSSSSASAASGSSNSSSSTANTSVNTCLITNIPIQKWVNIIVSLYGLTLDVYLDGKLVRTCVMPGVPQINNNSSINVTNKGGFSGWTTSFKYWSDASNPQQAYNIYKDGYGGSILGNLISKYRVRVSMVSDSVVKSSFEI